MKWRCFQTSLEITVMVFCYTGTAAFQPEVQLGEPRLEDGWQPNRQGPDCHPTVFEVVEVKVELAPTMEQPTPKKHT